MRVRMFGIKKKNLKERSDVRLLVPETKARYDSKAALAKATLVFLLVYGSIGGFLSAYGIDFQKEQCISAIFFLSLLLSAVYETKRKWAVNLVNILVFVLYVYIALRKFWAINSGYYAIINTILSEAQRYLGVTGRTEYGLVVENETAAVTGFVLFLGMVGTILLQIRLHHKASLFTTVMLTLPLYAIPFYFEKVPGTGYIMLLFTGYAVVAALQGAGAWEDLSGQTRHILPSMLLFTVMTVQLTALVLPREGYAALVRANAIKKASERQMANIVRFGLPALFGQGGNGAGVSGGLLGKGYSVMPDYETDLVVRYTPYDYEPVYLKAFTGKDYMGDRWTRADDDDAWMEQTVAARADCYVQGNPDGTGMGWEYFEFHPAAEAPENVPVTDAARDLRADGSADSAARDLGAEDLTDGAAPAPGAEDPADNAAPEQGCGIMEIDNVGAAAGYEYRPYYTGVVRRGGMNAEFLYFPSVMRPDNAKEDVDENYLIVPVSCKRAVDRICAGAGFSGTPGEIARQIRAYFDEHYTYTLRPGFYYGDPDYITHFLTESRRGYCAHFASSAVMLLRSMGIPARYAEGYVFTYEQVVLDGTLVENADYERYYSGYSPIGETALVEIEVSDASAHAWVEMYVDGEGWVVFDPTPAADGDDERASFWEDFLNRGTESEDAGFGGSDIGVYVETALGGLAYGLLCLAAAGVLYVTGKYLYLRVKEARMSAKERAKLEYRRFIAHLSRKNKEFAVLRTIGEQTDWVNAHMRRRFTNEQREALYRLFFADERNAQRDAEWATLSKHCRKLRHSGKAR